MSDDSSGRLLTVLTDLAAASPPGSQLPSTRALVAQHHVSPVTVQKVLRELTSRGVVESRPGVGTFVRAVRQGRPADFTWQTAALGAAPAPGRGVPGAMRTVANDVLALHSGYPDPELLPQRLVRSALARAGRGDAALSRPPVAGLPELQGWFAGELAAVTAVGVFPVAARDVVVLPGSQSGLGAIFRALVGAGQPLVVESPTYWGALDAAHQAGVRIVPIPSGPSGPEPADLDRALYDTGARVFYAQPTYANPTGAQWSEQRSTEVLDVVRRHGAFLVEDDWAHDLGITSEPRPLAAQDDSGHVVYLRSLTKSLSPALRVAAVVARGPARDRILRAAATESMYVSGLLQAATLDAVTQPGWRSHLRGLRQQLRVRRDLLCQSLTEHAPTVELAGVPAGGLNLWVRLPDGTDLDRVTQECERRGVLVTSGDEWFPAEPPGPFLRLSFAGANPSAFPQAARVLGAVLADVRSSDAR
jgi:DNA-binding transcriptional MocR family regulator